MYGIDHLSFSSIKTFLDCQLKWKFTYIDKYPVEPTFPIIVGKVIHSAIEKYYRSQASLESALEQSLSQEAVSDTEIITTTKLILSNKNVVNYLNLISPIFIEKEFQIHIKDVKIIGFIDCILDDGTVIDFKVTDRFNKKFYWLQPLIYLRGCYENQINFNGLFSFVIIPKNREGKVDTWSIELKKEDYINTLNQFMDLFLRDFWYALDQNNFSHTTNISTCQYCQFNKICPFSLVAQK